MTPDHNFPIIGLDSGAPNTKVASDALVLLFVAVLPFGVLLDVSLVGQLFLTELVFIAMIPFLWLTAGSISSPAIRSILWWLFAWFVVQIATDVYRGTFIGDYLRGWAKLIFFAMDIYVLCKLLKKELRLLIWAFSWNVAYGIYEWRQFDDLQTRWKFGVGMCAVNALLTLALLIWPKRKLLIAKLFAVICVGAGATSLFLNARNTFLSLSVAGFLLGLVSLPGARRQLIKLWDRHAVLLMLGVMATAYAAGAIYVEGASKGYFGDDARVKLEGQQNDAFGPVLGVLAGGRAEFNASFAAIGDSPIIGFGSSARSAYYYNVYVENVRTNGTPDQIRTLDSQIYVGEPPIPTHSHLFGAWVEGGIAGAAFWLFVLRKTFQATRRSIELSAPHELLVLLNSVAFIWSILFSPFGGDARLVTAFTLALFMFKGSADTVNASHAGDSA